MFKRIVWKIFNCLYKYIAAPRMIMGYKHYSGAYLPYVRISNTTSIVGLKSFDVEDNVFIGHYNMLDASNGLTIQAGCQITNYVSILTHSSHIAIRLYGEHYIEYNGKHFAYQVKSTRIGKYTFIGPHSVIMPGVHIGMGSLISAYSYVKSGHYPDFAILAGNPAVVVGDTRDIDKEYLDAYPQLQEYYAQWSK